MGLVTHKYMVDRMPLDELRRTFAAREHTLEYLVRELRGQARSKTLKSYLIYGPRGSGKTTLVRMLALHLEEDPQLRAAWLPVVFPEESPGLSSLRDLLAAILHTLTESGISGAQDWLARVDAEPEDRASRDLAAAALNELAHAAGRRLVVFVENLNALWARGHEQGLDRQERAALRGLLMAPEPCLMLVGTAVKMFPELERYDEALFQYFLPVPLDRLDDEQVRLLLFRRAEFDGHPDFARQYRVNQDKIRSLTRLTGGNPRLILMLYEIITVGALASIMQTLLSLVDSLTPLLKDVIEHQMTRQQAKVLDALMRAGGTAQPRDLVRPTRLSLNTVTTQLTRLKEMQLLEVQGGGKGRPAYYSTPDRLFSTWYQLRYLRSSHRRIELFVEFLRLWFEEDARCELLRRLVAATADAAGTGVADAPLALEYVAASLQDTAHAGEAQDAAVRRWLDAGCLNEAAFALAEFEGLQEAGRLRYEAGAYSQLGRWAIEHADLPTAMASARAAIDRDPRDYQALMTLGLATDMSGDYQGASEFLGRALQIPSLPLPMRALALSIRGVGKGQCGDLDGAIADYTAVIELPGAPPEQVAGALIDRGIAKGQRGDLDGEIVDYTVAIELPDAPPEQVAAALIDRGITRGRRGDIDGEIADYTAAIELPGALPEQVAWAFVGRGFRRCERGDLDAAIADCTAAIELPGALPEQVARALIDRGRIRHQRNDYGDAITDFSTAIELPNAPAEFVSWARVSRGVCALAAGRMEEATGDFKAVALPPEVTLEARYWAVAALLLVSAKRHESVESITLARTVAEGLANGDRVRFLTGVLRALRTPAMQAHWPGICRALCEGQPPAVAEQLQFLLPVCEVLETGDRSKLDPLPPEQRDFALEVLSGFDSPVANPADHP
ncbi:MAG: tetratricopeptide repeat protein [Candidatus Latescibacterota bacterium]|jgi:tetratricopeptide (TPR) repeat protein/energy-coupling factor transporter ATP-binding protein EcfA2